MTADNKIRDLVKRIEDQIASTYAFPIHISASDCLIDEPLDKFSSKNSFRSAVYVHQSPACDEISLGIFIPEDLTQLLCAANPFEKLYHSNLDAFWVFVEEVSHFHLLANRASSDRKVTLLELEWQGEIDKMICAGSLLLKQTGKTYFRQLAYLLFEKTIITAENEALYREASRIAAQHWYKVLPHIEELPETEKYILALESFKAVYRRHWSEKLSHFSLWSA